MTAIDETQLVRIARLPDTWQANLLQAELDAAGIAARTSGDAISSWQIGIPSDVSVLVLERDRIRATAIADQFLTELRGKPTTIQPATAGEYAKASSKGHDRGRVTYLVINLIGFLAIVGAMQSGYLALALAILSAVLIVAIAYLLRRRLEG